MGKTPPPRATVSPPDPNETGSALDWLSCHPVTLYLEAMRSFASYGDVDGCYVLLTRLYQLAMYRQGLIAFPVPSNRRSQRSSNVTPHLSQRQRMEADTKERAHAEKRKKEEAERSPFTPTSDILAAMMTAYAMSSTPYPVAHHQQVFSHHSSLNVAPTVEFYHSLLMYHAHHHTVHTYIASMSLLSRSRHPPSLDEYIRAIRYFGLNCKDQDAALVLFLHLSSVAMPNATAFNSLIAVFAEKGDWMMAYRLMTDMERQRQWPSAWTYASVIKALLVDGKETVAMELHQWAKQWKRKEAESRKERWMDNCYVALMEHQMQKGEVDRVMATWDEMRRDGVRPERTTYTLVIRALLKADKADQARVVVDEMRRKQGLAWDAVAYYTALQAMAAQGDYRAAQQLYAEMVKFMESKHLSIPSHVYTTLISAFPSSIPTPTKSNPSPTPSFTPLLLSLDLLSLLRAQQRRGVLPTPSFFRSLLSLLRAYGAHEGAQRLADERRRQGQEQVSWSSAVIDKAEEDVVRELKGPQQSSTSLSAHLHSEPPAQSAMLHV